MLSSEKCHGGRIIWPELSSLHNQWEKKRNIHKTIYHCTLRNSRSNLSSDSCYVSVLFITAGKTMS